MDRGNRGGSGGSERSVPYEAFSVCASLVRDLVLMCASERANKRRFSNCSPTTSKDGVLFFSQKSGGFP